MTTLFASVFLAAATSTNAWLADWDTPYGMPPFNELKVSEYVDAVKKGCELKQERIKLIVENKEEPTFKNTIVPYIFADKELTQASRVFGVLFSLERDEEREKASIDAIPIFTADTAKTISNRELFNRIEAVWRSDKSGLTEEEKTILKRIYDSFRRNGVALSAEKRARLREINAKSSELSLKFSKNLLASNNQFKKEFGVDVSDYYDVIATTDDRARREAMFKAYISRGFNPGKNDNKPIINEIAELRIEKAKILGYANPADFYNELRMPGSSSVALDFLKPIVKASINTAKKELEEIKTLFDRDVAANKLPKNAKFEPWDVFYYAEKLNKEKYDFSPAELKKYFKSENVLNAVLRAAERLYGIKAKKIDNAKLYNPSAATAYEITDSDGTYIGVFIADYSPRSTKSGGAWMSLFKKQMIDHNGKDIRPIVSNSCNFGEYLSPTQVITAFHEFGHALHGLLSKCVYPTVSCTGGYSEYNEIFSQINERRAFEPSLLAEYAISDSGEALKSELIAKMKAADNHCSGILTTKLSISALVDLEWNLLNNVDGIDPEEFERKVCENVGLPYQLVPRHRLAHFKHIFAGGYNAGYYTYLWAEVLDRHLYSVFEDKGDVWDKDLAMKFRKTFLEKGASEEPMKLFKSFTGADKPNTEAFFKSRGLETP